MPTMSNTSVIDSEGENIDEFIKQGRIILALNG